MISETEGRGAIGPRRMVGVGDEASSGSDIPKVERKAAGEIEGAC